MVLGGVEIYAAAGLYGFDDGVLLGDLCDLFVCDRSDFGDDGYLFPLEWVVCGVGDVFFACWAGDLVVDEVGWVGAFAVECWFGFVGSDGYDVVDGEGESVDVVMVFCFANDSPADVLVPELGGEAVGDAAACGWDGEFSFGFAFYVVMAYGVGLGSGVADF